MVSVGWNRTIQRSSSPSDEAKPELSRDEAGEFPFMDVYPVGLERLPGERLRITWSDGQRRVYRYRELQENCPCASCREKRRQPPTAGQLPVLRPEETQPLEIQRMEPVGNYAYHIIFNHGCGMGIYSFELLRALGEPEATRSNEYRSAAEPNHRESNGE
ncbi:MAG: hypothetical protein KatS3mg110_2447 [Pirellulaceae bacterium]|nr:MAG: hypothetical protein KatS3mg110_2447 [Pirellulaceae bacterium]